jgi:hypothetical protein
MPPTYLKIRPFSTFPASPPGGAEAQPAFCPGFIADNAAKGASKLFPSLAKNSKIL